MEVHAILKNVPMSAQKMRETVRQIQGLPALKAKAILAFVPRKSARFVAKTLDSAIANAENNNKLKPESLRVKEAVAGTAMQIKRFTPKARGSLPSRAISFSLNSANWLRYSGLCCSPRR